MEKTLGKNTTLCKNIKNNRIFIFFCNKFFFSRLNWPLNCDLAVNEEFDCLINDDQRNTPLLYQKNTNVVYSFKKYYFIISLIYLIKFSCQLI